jgi:tetratricopeptide (TPR) repeat protein
VRLEAIRVHLLHHELAAPLSLLARQASGDEVVALEEMVDACREIRDWGYSHGDQSTTREFAHLMARLAPDDLPIVLEAARIARDTGDHNNAESWFRHCARCARRSGEWDKYADAYIGLGLLFTRLGNLAAAEELTERARRVASRHRQRSVAAGAHHSLFILAATRGRRIDAYVHAEDALRYYGSEHPCLPALVHDVGRCLIDTGDYVRAHSVMEVVASQFEEDPDACTRTRSNLAWAAAGAGDLNRFTAYTHATIDAIKHGACPQAAAEGYLHLAYGLSLLDKTGAATQMAEHARSLSFSSGARYVLLKVEDFLTHVACGVDIRQHSTSRLTESPKVAFHAKELVAALISAVSGSR